MAWQWWCVAAALLAAFEVATPSFFFLPFAVGCLVAPLVPWTLTGQLAVVAAVGLIGAFAVRPLVLGRQTREHFGAEALVGQIVRAHAERDDLGSTSFRAQIAGDSWPLIPCDGRPLTDGQNVRIIAVGGASLTVEPLQDSEQKE